MVFILRHGAAWDGDAHALLSPGDLLSSSTALLFKSHCRSESVLLLFAYRKLQYFVPNSIFSNY